MGMDRREFIKKASLGATVVAGFSFLLGSNTVGAAAPLNKEDSSDMGNKKLPEGVGKPIISFPFLFTRVDNTPSNEREMFPTNTVDVNGNPIPEPHKNYDKLALETNPNLMYEHWQEYWRKVHGPKFLFKEGEKDNSLDYLMSYNQVHRMTAGPSSQWAPPYNLVLGPDNMLPPNPAAVVPAYKRPSWDGMAYLSYKSYDDAMKFFMTDKYMNKIRPDESVFSRISLVLASAEYIIIPGPEVPDSVIAVKIYYKKNQTRENFQKNLLWDYTDFVYSKPDVHKYATRFSLLLNIGPNDKNDPLYQEAGQRVDAVSMMSFRNFTECERYFTGDDYRSIEAFENEFIDTDKSEWFTAVNFNIVNNPEKEVVTNRNIRPKL